MSGITLGMSTTYNASSTPQKAAIQSSFDFIEEGINALDVSNVSIIADYGSSQGANSIHAMKKIIDCLRKQKKSKIDPLVIHNDLPTNDWTSLHRLLNEDKTYHGVASGRSFYEQCLPTSSVSVGYSSTAIHWLSKKPCDISNHCAIDLIRSPKEYEVFRQQSFVDYSNFLKNRSSELIFGGVLILTMICSKEGRAENKELHNLLYECAQLLPMTTNELQDFTLPIFFQSYKEILDENLFKQYSFQLINSKIDLIASPIFTKWKDEEITTDEFIHATTSFVRSWSLSIIEQTFIKNGRTQNEIPQLLNEFWKIYEDKLRSQPDIGHNSTRYAYVVLKKQ
ncbi:hypothetical protein I4U23_005948 [Adineta vaga]|nr:hypothetical protein I4U23_005948 [Adineta vaga]